MAGRSVWVALLAPLTILALAVGACGGGAASTADGPRATTTVAVSPSTGEKPKDPRDKLACDQMQTVMAKMARAAVAWVPAQDPFDRAVGTQIRILSLDMAGAERQSSSGPVRASLHDNTVAFTSLAQAMAGTSKKKVDGAVRGTQVAYAKFKRTCGFA